MPPGRHNPKKCYVRTFEGMGVLVRVLLPIKSGLVFFLTAKTKKLAIYSTVQPVLNICKFLTLVLDDLQTSAIHKNGVEFCQEFNGHG